MSALLEDVHYLAGTIGPRGTGTSAESAAADHVFHRLVRLGLSPDKYSFRAVSSQNAFPLAAGLIALLAVVIYPLNGTITRWLAAVLSLSAAWFLWQAIRSAFNPLRLVLPKITSQNVEAHLKPEGNPRVLVVLLAHLDTNRCRLVWQSQAVKNIKPMTWLTLSMPVCTGLIFLTGALLKAPTWFWWLSFPFALYVFGEIITLILDDRTPYSPGAHDNAASVAVALEVARQLSISPLQSTEVWFVFDGAEETDHAGVLDLLSRHTGELDRAFFIGLEGLGSGEIVYLKQEGICIPYHPSPNLLMIAERVSSKHPELNFHSEQMPIEDDVRTLHGRGYHAICIAGRDPHSGVLPYWHRPDDTPDKISEETMQQAVNIVMAFLEEIDGSSSSFGKSIEKLLEKKE